MWCVDLLDAELGSISKCFSLIASIHLLVLRHRGCVSLPHPLFSPTPPTFPVLQPHPPTSYQHTPNRPVHTMPCNITSSPLNASFILNQSSNSLLPPDSLCLDDSSLGILSAVACYHGELSSSGSLTEKVEALRVHSTSGG